MSSKFFKGGNYVYEKLVPKIKKNLTERRETFESMTSGSLPKKAKKDLVTKGSKLWDVYEKQVTKRKKLLIKTVGGAGAATAGAAVVHEGAKKKWPKYKKVMESSVIKKKK